MMEKLGTFVVKRRWWIVSIWVIAAILIVGLSPKIASIESDDQSSFLPANYESVKADNLGQKISKQSDAPTDIIVFSAKDGGQLSSADQAKVTAAVAALNSGHLSHVVSVTTSSQQLAPSKKAQLATVTYSGDAQATSTIDAVATVRSALAKQVSGSDIKAGVTGGQAISYDTQDASTRALKIVGIGTILLVLILPALIFKSPLAGLLPVLSVGVVFSIANSLIADAGHLFGFHISNQLSILFTVVLFGIGTDYILFLLFRYRERLRSGDHTRGAVSYAVGRAGEAILSAALVVLSSFAALFFAKFGIFSSLAPGLVICVVVMMLAALTLIPALVAIIGEKVFWPSKAWMVKSEKPTISKKIGHLIARRPGSVTAVVIVVLLVLAGFAATYKADFSSFSQPPKGSLSAASYNQLTTAFSAGQLDPTEIYVSSSVPLTTAELQPLTQKLKSVAGVQAVLPAVVAGNNKQYGIVTLILKNDPFSAAAITTVKNGIYPVAHGFNSGSRSVYVGGATSSIADVQRVTDRDLGVIFPIAAVFIFIILFILLRSLVAPIVLLVCVSLGYAATLGITTIVFQHIAGDSGLISFIPLFMYIFVVAIGTDYNILTVTRLREEVREGNAPRKAADLTVEHSSATVASAGTILAATFASLTLAGIGFLTQMGTAIAAGVALAAFVIAPFLIPSLSALIGYAFWWPGHKPGSKQ